MKVILVNGSPHHNGCTATALAEVARTLNECGIETQDFWIGIKPIAGCLACRQCCTTGECVFTDVVNLFNQYAAQADGFVFGTPVYYAHPSGQILSFLDRVFYSGSRHLAHKPAAALASCRRGGNETSFDVLNKYFAINNMPIVTSQYWNGVHGNTPDEVRRDIEGLQTMRTLGRNMAWLLRCIEAGRNAGIDKPVLEDKTHTNFIR
ncbi:MAG: flavodoxin family protein [Muribaculaceae bacterium]|nr:flavodoxin family protein [Muribaculaceae bacterium]